MSIIFFSCAVQSPPTGGAPDLDGPYIKNINPPNSTFDLDDKKNIEIIFNEMIDPNTIKSSIDIFPYSDIQINSFNNKIIIKPQNQWPKNQIFKIKLSRNISDFHGNKLKKGKVITYNTGRDMPPGIISGKLFNNDDISNIGLYRLESDSLVFIYSVENNSLNEFKFQNISNGRYVLIGLDNLINNIKNDIRINRYALISEEIIINNNTVNNCDLNFSYPAFRKKVSRFRMNNSHVGLIEFNDGEIMFILNKKYINYYGALPTLDNIIFFEDTDDSINIKLNNNVEYYQITKRLINEQKYRVNFRDWRNHMNVTDDDTLNPYIDYWDFKNNNLIIKFSEPVIIEENKEPFTFFEYDDDEIYFTKLAADLNYALTGPLTLTVFMPPAYLSKIMIENKFVKDLSENSLTDTLLKINIVDHFSDKIAGGNIFGKIIYEGKNKIIVEAINILNGETHKEKMDRFGNYKFYNLDVGKYQIWAYEDVNDINSNYFNGTIEPLQFSAKFGYYNDVIETRTKWDIEDIRIKIN